MVAPALYQYLLSAGWIWIWKEWSAAICSNPLQPHAAPPPLKSKKREERNNLSDISRLSWFFPQNLAKSAKNVYYQQWFLLREQQQLFLEVKHGDVDGREDDDPGDDDDDDDTREGWQWFWAKQRICVVPIANGRPRVRWKYNRRLCWIFVPNSWSKMKRPLPLPCWSAQLKDSHLDLQSQTFMFRFKWFSHIGEINFTNRVVSVGMAKICL